MANDQNSHMQTGARKDIALDQPIYYAIVGETTNTNVGLARFMGLILVFIATGGFISWLLG